MHSAPVFSALLTPHNALSRRGLRIVVIIVCVLAAIPGLVFFALGAWPVVGFLGLDVVALYWALSSSRLAGKRRYEEVKLWPDRLTVLQVGTRGDERRAAFNPFFVRLVVNRDADERTTGLILRTRESELEIGAFLNPDDKASFARAFGAALRDARA